MMSAVGATWFRAAPNGKGRLWMRLVPMVGSTGSLSRRKAPARRCLLVAADSAADDLKATRDPATRVELRHAGAAQRQRTVDWPGTPPGSWDGGGRAGLWFRRAMRSARARHLRAPALDVGRSR
jgi:hypothetical protein